MAQIAILIGVEVGLAIASSFLQPKPKQEPIDRGKMDDLRFTIVEEGAFIPRVYGDWVRLGGNLFWGTPTQEHRSTTPGSSGGKKGRGAEPPTTTFFYDKSFAAYCCEGPIRSFRRIKEGDTVIFNQATETSSYYEAERTGNTLAGGATIVLDATLLSGKKVRLPAGASVTFTNVRANITGTFDVGIYFQSDAIIPITVRVNGATDYASGLFDSNNGLAAFDVTVNLTLGNNTIKITNNHGSQPLDIDRIFVFPQFIDPGDGNGGGVTGILQDGPYPATLDNPSQFYNKAIRVDHLGSMTGSVAAAGQANLEFYLGTEDQPQSPTMVLAEGSANVPAHRGVAYIVAKDYQVRNGQLDNLTFEIEPLLNDLADILAAEYKLRGAVDSQLDFEALRGTIVEGLYIDRLAPLSETVEALKFFFSFDVVPADGKIKAVPRGGASVRTIPFKDLLAHQEGEQPPNGITIEHVEATDLPGGLYIAYVSPLESKEFHTGSQFVPLGFGPSLEAETVNLPIVVTNPDEIVAAGKRYLFGRQIEKDPHAFNLSPKHRDLIPTDVVTLQLPQKTIDVRITSHQAALPGLVKAKALPEKAGLYNQIGVGEIGTGTEILKTKFPANSYLYLADTPPARDSDTGLFHYGGLCPRGVGSWEGGYIYEETVEDSDEFQRLAAISQAATIGVLVTGLPGVSGDLDDLDTTNTLTLDLYFDEGLFESRPEEDIRNRDVNMLIIGSGPFAQILKFTTALYENSFAPFVRRVKLSGLLHGLRGTDDGAFRGASAGTPAALLTDAIRRIPDQFEKLGEEREFKGATVGQALVDAISYLFTNNGASKRPLRCFGVSLAFDGSNDALIQFDRHPNPDEEPAIFAVEIWTSTDRSNPANRKRIIPVTIGTTHACLLDSNTSTTTIFDGSDTIFFTTSHADKNNLVPGASQAAAQTLETLESTFTRFDFTFRVDDDSAVTTTGVLANAAIEQSATLDTGDRFPDATVSPIFIQWEGDGVGGTTIVEKIKTFNTVLGTPRILPWGPDGLTVRYTILLSGTEYRVYADYVPGRGDQPLAIVASPGAGFPFPLRLKVSLIDTSIGPFHIDNIVSAGNLIPSTIYSNRDQVKDFGSPQTSLYLRIYQNSRHPQVGAGFPLDVAFPAQKSLLESGDKLLLESSDKILLE